MTEVLEVSTDENVGVVVLDRPPHNFLDYEQIASRLGYNKAVSARVRYHRARDERKAAVKLCFAGYDLPGQ